MAPKKQSTDPNAEIIELLKKGLVLQLFEMGVSQEEIGKKLKMQKLAVNNVLKGIKKENSKKEKKPK